MKQLIITALALSAFGCGSSSLPPATTTQAESAISAAEAVGANDIPRAALHLKLAEEQLHVAKKLIEEGEEDKARLTLERARLDAQVALALAREVEAKRKAQTALQEVNELENTQ